mmetsp:Transcript_3787/g.6732  ORF Transcript_3787/g.6732 Transcript_3787/m.6732 type:complete len:83 (+) Transcript_3787:2583-2831(+)
MSRSDVGEFIVVYCVLHGVRFRMRTEENPEAMICLAVTKQSAYLLTNCMTALGVWIEGGCKAAQKYHVDTSEHKLNSENIFV